MAGNFINESGSNTNFNNSYLYLSDAIPFDDGNILGSGNVNGQLNALYVPSGYADVQNWNASILNACVSETSGNDIPGTNDCQVDYIAEFGEVACFDVEPMPGNQMVNLLNHESILASGTTTPKISNFNIPSGNNRQLIVVGFFERNHCGNCPSGTNYNGLGDNYANGSDAIGEAGHTLNFRVAGSTTKIKANKTNDSFGNYHSARNMFFHPQNNWEDELEDYHKAIYSNELYFTIYNESEIDNLLGGANNGEVTIDFQNLNNGSHAGDDAILQVFLFENVAQTENGVALTGKKDEGHDFFPVDHIYQIDNLQDGYEANELTDGILAIGYSPINNDFTNMPGYVGFAGLRGNLKNTEKGSTNHGESTINGKSDKVTTKGMFRRGPVSGIIDHITMHQEGINPSSENPLGGVVIVFTLESVE